MKKMLPLISVILVIGLFIAAYLYIPKTYDIYEQALEFAKSDQYLKDILGNDIRDSIFVYSHISRGAARIEVTISGNKDSGLLLIRGSKKDNNWELTNVLFEHTANSKRYAVFKKSKT